MAGRIFKNIYFVFAAVLAAVVLGGTVVVAVFYKINAAHILLSAAVWLAVFALLLKYCEKTSVVAAAVLAGVAARILYAVFCTQMPESDFNLYYNLAVAFSGGSFKISKYSQMFPHVTGYSFLLGIWFKMFGASVACARILNVVFDVLTVLFLYLTARRLFGKRAAGFTACLFALCPSVIMYCGLVCTEKASLMLISAFLYVITYIAKKPLPSVCACAVLSALANAVRPNGVILVITLVIACFCLVKNKKGFLFALLAVVIYAGSAAALNAAQTHNFGETASNPTGWNLYVGFNTQSYGQWNEEDAAQLEIIMNDYDADRAHQILRNMAFERIKENDITQNAALICSKLGVMWSNDIAVCSYLKDDGIYKLMQNSFSAEAVISGFYFVFIMASLFAADVLRKRKDDMPLPVMLVILGTAALHLLSEVMGRYSYPGVVCMLVLCGILAEKNIPFLQKKISRFCKKSIDKNCMV